MMHSHGIGMLLNLAFDRQSKQPPACRCETHPAVNCGNGHYQCSNCRKPVSVHVRHQGQNIGRNQRCPCNSGKKFKTCCLPANSLRRGGVEA